MLSVVKPVSRTADPDSEDADTVSQLSDPVSEELDRSVEIPDKDSAEASWTLGEAMEILVEPACTGEETSVF